MLAAEAGENVCVPLMITSKKEVPEAEPISVIPFAVTGNAMFSV